MAAPPRNGSPGVGGSGAAIASAPGRRSLAERICGRCRAAFPADPSADPFAVQEWWVCPACRRALLGIHDDNLVAGGSPVPGGGSATVASVEGRHGDVGYRLHPDLELSALAALPT